MWRSLKARKMCRPATGWYNSICDSYRNYAGLNLVSTLWAAMNKRNTSMAG